MRDNFVEHRAVVQWLDYMTGRLDEYEIERNEYLSAYGEQAPASFRFFEDVVLGFAENTILMDNLAAGREEIQYVEDGDGLTQNRLQLHTIIQGQEVKAEYPEAVALAPEGDPVDGTGDISYPHYFPYLLRHRGFDEKNPSENTLAQALKDKRIGGEDVEVVLPNVHTFYSVLENFIRNSAKHAEHLNERKALNVYLSINDPGDEHEYYNLLVYDDVSEVDAEDAVGFQRAIEGVLIGPHDQEGKSGSLGIADMKFSSFLMFDADPSEMSEGKLSKHLSVVAFHGDVGSDVGPRDYTVLREIDEDEEDESRRVEVLKRKLDGKESCHFGYCFKLVKSKKVCWIGPKLKGDGGALRSHGIYSFGSLDQFKKPGDEKTLAAFDFVVIESSTLAETDGEAFERTLLQFPYRVLLVRSGDVPDWLDDWLDENSRQVHQTMATPSWDNEEDTVHDCVLNWCWRVWLERWDIAAGESVHLHLYTEGTDGVGRWRFEKKEEGEPEDVVKEHLGGVVEMTVTSNAQNHTSENLDDVASLIVYDRHGGLLKHGFNSANLQGNSRHEAQKLFESPTNFCNSFYKHTNDFSYLNYPPTDRKQRERSVYQLVEAGRLRVLVLDERIVKLSPKAPHRSMSSAVRRKDFWHQARAANVFLVTHVTVGGEETEVAEGRAAAREKRFTKFTLDLDGEPSFHYSHRWCREGKWQGPSNQHLDLRPDVLIVHRTFVKSLSDRITDGSVKALVEHFQKSIPWIIIDSGTSHSLDGDAPFKFLPFSQLERQISQVGSNGIVSKIQLAKRILTLTRIDE